MSRATKHLAEKSGDGVGGLLNATFGNAAELIIAFAALRKALLILAVSTAVIAVAARRLFDFGDHVLICTLITRTIAGTSFK